MSVTEEHKILSAEKPVVSLFPERTNAQFVASLLAGPILTGAVDLLTYKFDEKWTKGGLLNLPDGTTIKQGSIKDIFKSPLRVKEVTLTNQNFLILTDKLLFDRNQRVMVLPLKYAKSSKLHKKDLFVQFELLIKGDNQPRLFTFQISRLENADEWAAAIQNMVAH